MNKFTSIKSKVIPLRRKDVDTDMIIPAQYLTSVSREGYGENLFKRLREQDAQFPFNQTRYSGAAILAADSNFGCGSSREHAVWALLGAGIKVVIGKSFADIFSSNSGKNGLVLVTLPDDVMDGILSMAENGDYKLAVDLPLQKVTLPDGSEHAFAFDSYRKHCILNGLDDLDYILSHRSSIEKFRQEHAPFYTAPAATINTEGRR